MAKAKKAVKKPPKGKIPVAKKPEPKVEPKPGRPTKKTAEILAKICEGIAQGASSRAMCVVVNISQPTLWLWLDQDKAFSKQYARAKDKCAEVLAEEIIEIADDGSGDMIKDEKTGVETINNEFVQRSRLRIDARKWYASKVAPKKYGDKVVQEHQGVDGGPITMTQVPAPDYERALAALRKHETRKPS